MTSRAYRIREDGRIRARLNIGMLRRHPTARAFAPIVIWAAGLGMELTGIVFMAVWTWMMSPISPVPELAWAPLVGRFHAGLTFWWISGAFFSFASLFGFIAALSGHYHHRARIVLLLAVTGWWGAVFGTYLSTDWGGAGGWIHFPIFLRSLFSAITAFIDPRATVESFLDPKDHAPD